MKEFFERLPRAWKRFILLSVDLLFVPVALYFSFCLETNSLWPTQSLIENWSVFPVTISVAAIVSISLGIPSIRLNAFEARATIRTGVFATVIALFVAAISGMARTGIPLSVFVIFAFLQFGLSVSSRVLGLQVLMWIYRRGQKQTRILVYGAGGTGVQLIAAIGQSEEIEPVGFLDDNKTLQGMMVAGLPVFAPSRVQTLIAEYRIDRVVLAMPSLSLPRQMQIARRLMKLGCDVHRLPSFSELIGNKDLIRTIEPVQPSEYLGRNKLDSELPGAAEIYSGKSVLVSGAGGSIGAELCRQLLTCKLKKLVLFEQSEAALYAIDLELRAQTEELGVEIVAVIGSTTDKTRVERTVIENGVDTILHAAAYKHVPMVEANKVEGLRNNIIGTKNIADVARDAKIERFVLVSTDKAVRPTNVMGASKRLAEMIIQDMASRPSDTLFSMVRFGNVLGSSGSVIPLFNEQIARGGPVTVTHSEVTRYFMTISEAARLVLLAGGFSRGGDVFVLDMGKPVQIRKLAAQMIERAGYTVRNSHNPDGDIEIVITGLRPGEKLYEELLIGEDMKTTQHPKILRAEEECLSEIEVANMLRDLRLVVTSGDENGAIDLIKRWVNGYQAPRNAGVR